jgi:23S rRNA (cytidine1920-2'-O)/16S rRNA (cytidine1409-2'-O)-methyltransferase
MRSQHRYQSNSNPTTRSIRLRRRLDAELVRRGLAGGRDEAKRLIADGIVSVDGSSLVKPATLVADSSAIALVESRPKWASRGALKLQHALDTFDLDVADARALDVGASTGGFTDVLLSYGAASIVAVDVGYGQMVWRLSQDDRVTVFDRTNFRTVDPTALGGPFSVVVVDVSFISVTLLAPMLAAVSESGSHYVVLVKPQFEVGKGSVGRGGIVTDVDAHSDAISGVIAALGTNDLGAVALTSSPITGAKGNREFLLHARSGHPGALTSDDIDRTVSA